MEVEGTIDGWKSYKFHPEIKVQPGINRTFFQYGETREREIIQAQSTQRTNKLNRQLFASQCPGCGARKTVFQNGKTLCAYCKNELPSVSASAETPLLYPEAVQPAWIRTPYGELFYT